MDKINITLPDGKILEFDGGVTGMEIATSISEGLARNAVGIIVNDEPYDLSRPIETDAHVSILKFDDEEGKAIYWHSSAHLMAEAVESIFPGTKFGIGPPVENGFYYDMDIPDHQLTPEDLEKIEKKMAELAKQDNTFERIPITWEEAVAYFTEKGDKYKLELLEEFKDREITFYRQGNFTDLCRGTHVPSTGVIKAIKLTSVSSAYWRGDQSREQLQRVYGITFPKKKMLDDHMTMLEEAKKRDHRKLGRELELFHITPEVGVGLPLWLPKGTTLRETLENFLRVEQKRLGYLPVVTPHIGNLDLYKTSGHYPYYAESQFTPIHLDEQESYLLKPMNCPHHCHIYKSKPRSYRDLPVRLAEFGTVYRYEKSGQLNGLTRVRGFTVDDSHIFARPDQVKEELGKVIGLIKFVMTILQFQDFSIRLSFSDPDNREKYVGSKELWDQAEQALMEVAEANELDYKVDLGEAAFYGPKIDFMVRDAIGREWQLGTVQLDYNLPERFDLEYMGQDGERHRPVMIHRAPFGSLERFIGVLIEHFAGNFPFWLAPVQAIVLPISEHYLEYGAHVRDVLVNAGYRVELDERGEKIGYKIREAEMQKVPYMLIVGEKEKDANAVAVRIHGEGDQGTLTLEELQMEFLHLNRPEATGPQPAEEAAVEIHHHEAIEHVVPDTRS
ncbi:MAG: threonine--tRNA ligase [Ignavibacteriae bacterium]|nr:threonine--tRNA ligase [Ignavibacteriota bacterium]MCB9216094.1 threonine--tRNA ligase [Ignavibacteria bacterium]